MIAKQGFSVFWWW